MYKAEKMVLYSRINHPDELESWFGRLWTNGTYIRNGAGEIVGRFTRNDAGIFYFGICEAETFQGNITDRLLCQRIAEYFAKYFGTRFTNCATMAHFLTTGEFVECVRGNGMAVLQQGMRPYTMAGRVDLGDMLCIVYGDAKVARSRKFPEWRGKFIKAQKRRRKGRGFTASVPMKKRSFSAEEIREVCTGGLAQDFHFMVCVGHFRGRPVWLSQRGHMLPGTQEVPVVLTLGDKDPYQENDPLFTLIKKRR